VKDLAFLLLLGLAKAMEMKLGLAKEKAMGLAMGLVLDSAKAMGLAKEMVLDSAKEMVLDSAMGLVLVEAVCLYHHSYVLWMDILLRKFDYSDLKSDLYDQLFYQYNYLLLK
jgi:hypothetical protein